MNCMKCMGLGDESVQSRPHVVRACPECGREYCVAEPGKHGIGLKVQKGDRFVVPADFLKISANPLRSSHQLSRFGLSWFAELVFAVDLLAKENREDVIGTMLKVRDSNEELFRHADFLKDLNLNDPANQLEIAERFKPYEKTAEWWGYLAAALSHEAAAAVGRRDAEAAALWAACAERYRALALFKVHFEEVVYMGHSASRLVQLLKIWDANQKNSDEGFWQHTFREHAYAFSQLFSVPVTLIEGATYVGGTKIDGTDARYVDFMLSGGGANHVILVEIKTPVTKLLGSKYRRNYPPSRDLGGSIVQVNDYCHTMQQNIDRIVKERSIELTSFNPRRIVLMGNYKEELDDGIKQSSFEYFRSGLAGVEVVTFDEFFRKIEELAKLFSLAKAASNTPPKDPSL